MAKHPIGVHVGPGLTGDNELEDGGPLARAAEMDADGVQIFLTDPQSYKAPKPRPDAADLLDGDGEPAPRTSTDATGFHLLLYLHVDDSPLLGSNPRHAARTMM